MSVKTIQALKDQMPPGVNFQTSVADLYDILDTLEARTPVNQAGLAEDWSGEIRTPANTASTDLRYTICAKSAYARIIQEVYLDLGVGSAFTVTFYLDGVVIPGLSSVTVSTVPNTFLPTPLITIPVNSKVQMSVAGIGTPSEQAFNWTVKTVRA